MKIQDIKPHLLRRYLELRYGKSLTRKELLALRPEDKKSFFDGAVALATIMMDKPIP